jgi:hypothetical protein
MISCSRRPFLVWRDYFERDMGLEMLVDVCRASAFETFGGLALAVLAS